MEKAHFSAVRVVHLNVPVLNTNFMAVENNFFDACLHDIYTLNILNNQIVHLLLEL